MPADLLLIEGLVPPWVLRTTALTGRGRHLSFYLSSFANPDGAPRAELQARMLTASGGSVLFAAIAPPRFDAETATFAAYGFGNWAAYTDSGPGSIATYRTYTGSGTHRYYFATHPISGGSWAMWEYSFGEVTHVGYTHDSDLGWLSAPLPAPDEYSTYTGFVGASPCDPADWTTRTGPHETFGSPGLPHLLASSATQAGSVYTLGGSPPYACASSDAELELSDACQWSDLEAFAADVATKLSVTGLSYAPWAYSTGTGASDGTLYMRRRVARYRIESADRSRTVKWKIVKRRLLPNMSVIALTPTTTLAETENLELIERPYYDENGAWSPTDLAWDEIAERVVGWSDLSGGSAGITAQTAVAGNSGQIVSGYYTSPRIWASRVRAQIVTGAVQTVRWRVARDGVETFLDTIVTGGFSAPGVLGPEEGISTTTIQPHAYLDTAGEPVSGVVARVLYKQRRLWRIVGWPPFQVGAEPVPAHTYYRRRAWRVVQELDATAAWTGPSTQWHGPCEYRKEVAYHDDWDLTTGRLLDRVVTTAEATANELEWVPTVATTTATFGEIISGVLARTTATAPVVAQAEWPIDYTEDQSSSTEPVEVVEMDERVPAGRAGRWHYLEAPRGYSLHVEEAAWDTPFVGARVGFGKVGGVRVQ